MIWFWPVHKETNHVPKAVSDRDPVPDWVRDLNYVHSQALQTPVPITNRICEVIFCSYCAVCADWPRTRPMHGFSAHFQNAHARITFRKSFAFTCPQNQAFYADHDPRRPLFHVSKARSKAWFERALRSQRGKSGFQIRKGSESRSETASGTWFVPLWTGPVFNTTHIAHRPQSECYLGLDLISIAVNFQGPFPWKPTKPKLVSKRPVKSIS